MFMIFTIPSMVSVIIKIKQFQNLSFDAITFQGMKPGILYNGIFTYVGHEILVLKSYKLYKMFMTLEAIYLQFDRKTHLLL